MLYGQTFNNNPPVACFQRELVELEKFNAEPGA